MDVSLLIRLIDQVTGPAGKVRDSLQKIGGAAREFKGAFAQSIRQGFSVDNIEQATKNAEAALSRARSRLLGAVGTAMVLAAPVRMAAQFDQSMKGLEKVLDVPIERLKQLRKFALDTSALVPIAAKDVVELMAEAAQGGVPQAELEAFSAYVANAAVAFDMAGQEIGDRFAKLRNVYKLSQGGIEDLGDATNHLSNNMAAKAEQLTDFANRAAGAADIFKLTATQTTAVGAAMIAAGIVPETAARGFTAMSTRILSGGKEVDKAFKSIGMNRKAFLKQLSEDAPAALQTLFTTMSGHKNGMQALIDIVGRDFADDFAKFLGNPELLAQAFALIADKSTYAGSAVEEAAKQGSGATRQWDLLTNKLTRMAIVGGGILLPALLQLAGGLGDLVDKMAAFAEANPELTSKIVNTVAALMALSIASRLAAFGVASVRGPMIGLASTFLKFDKSGKNIATGWRIIAGAAGGVGAALSWLGTAATAAAGALATALGAITWPIWALVAAVAAAGFAIWKYWDRVSAFVGGFTSAIGDGLGAAASAAGDALAGLTQSVADLLGISPEQMANVADALVDMFDFSDALAATKEVLADISAWFGSFFSQELLTDEQAAGTREAGRRMGQALVDGVKAALEGLRDLLLLPYKLAFEIDWPEPPAWLQWLIDKGSSLVKGVGDVYSGKAQPITQQFPTAASRAMGGGLGGLADWFSGGADAAVNKIEAGGATAGERLGSSAASAINAGAQSAGAILGRAAAAEISKAVVNVRTAGAAGASKGVAGAIADAKAGALHGGTD